MSILTLTDSFYVIVVNWFIDSRSLFYFHGLGRDADFNVIRLNVLRRDRAGSDHRVFSDLCACQHGRVVSDACPISNARRQVVNFVEKSLDIANGGQ